MTGVNVRIAKAFLCVVSVCVSAFVGADVNSHWEKAEEYMFLSGSADFLNNTIEIQEAAIDQQTELMFHTLTTQQFMSDDIDVHLEKHNIAAKKIVRELFSAQSMKERIVPLYMANFSEAELDELIRFYKSPIGVVMRERLPLILMQSNEIDRELAQEVFDLMAPINEALERDLGILQ